MISTTINTHPMAFCRLCGASGSILYSELKDHLFGAPDEWTLKKCTNNMCGLVWLDPMPKDEDIGSLYQTYYTHTTGKSPPAITFQAKLLTALINPFFSLIMSLSGAKHQRKKLNYMYLLDTKPGLLLDVGCGDGARLLRLRKRGWKVEGQEVDENAACGTKQATLTIHKGDLNNLSLPDDHYDAIILNHVLEHLPHPEATINECLRLLKPGGTITATTPNVMSYGHSYFGKNWRGLEPPRHLYIYSCNSLLNLAKSMKLDNIEIWTSAARAESIALGSYMILSSTGQLGAPYIPPLLRARLFQLKAQLRYLLDRNSGEECIIRITKLLH